MADGNETFYSEHTTSRTYRELLVHMAASVRNGLSNDGIGAEYVPEFDELYEKIGRGVPVSLVEAITVVEIVETVKKQLHEKNIWYRLKAWCSKPTE
jgi:hypothetical protein